MLAGEEWIREVDGGMVKINLHFFGGGVGGESDSGCGNCFSYPAGNMSGDVWPVTHSFMHTACVKVRILYMCNQDYLTIK